MMHWQNKWFSRMKHSHVYCPPFIWEEVLDKIQLCTRLKDFTDNNLNEYKAVL